eukprot:scaffold53489_cov15-Tisochrysis_lutea.AAC.1
MSWVGNWQGIGRWTCFGAAGLLLPRASSWEWVDRWTRFGAAGLQLPRANSQFFAIGTTLSVTNRWWAGVWQDGGRWADFGKPQARNGLMQAAGCLVLGRTVSARCRLSVGG